MEAHDSEGQPKEIGYQEHADHPQDHVIVTGHMRLLTPITAAMIQAMPPTVAIAPPKLSSKLKTVGAIM
jgi:hypothetical protein